MSVSTKLTLVSGFKQAEMRLFVSCKLDDLATFSDKAERIVSDLKNICDSRIFFDLDPLSISVIKGVARDSREWIITRLYDETIKIEKKDDEVKPLDSEISEKAISILTKLSKDSTETEEMKMHAEGALVKYQVYTPEDNKIDWCQVDRLITAFKNLQDYSEDMLLAYCGCL